MYAVPFASSKVLDPTGLATKDSYDGVGRVTIEYQTDAGGDAMSQNPWNDAQNVTGDAVLTQVEPIYDADGNVILTTTRRRNHDETTTGALGNATTAPKARVSYVADYFDAANRPTTTVNVGTNAGTAYTRPSSPAAVATRSCAATPATPPTMCRPCSSPAIRPGARSR